MAKQPDPEIDAGDADCRAKLEAFWNALPPEERALREERIRREQARSEAFELAVQQFPYVITAHLAFGALPGSPGAKHNSERQEAWPVARRMGFTTEEFGRISPAGLRKLIALKAELTTPGIGDVDAQAVLNKLLETTGTRTPGAPKKPSTAQIHQAWLSLGKPTITASVCRDIAASVYRDEWAGIDKTDVARNKLVDRVKASLKRSTSSD